ncbi:MAG TPA: hypothetical protein VLB89_04810 [Gaiellaceae bacterium]|nr:hypothetical protein [Gaiellaceae bacterium]
MRMHGNRCSVKSAWIWLGTALAALSLPGLAKAEIVAPTASQALLTVARDGSPRVGYMSGRDVVVARRTAGGWKFVRAGRVPGTRPVLAGLAVDGRLRTSVLVEAENGSWLALSSRGGKLRVVARPRKKGESIGPAGLTLDAAGRPAFAYALRRSSGKTWLRLVTTDARGRLHTHGITKGGFPSSTFVAGAAPVLVGRRLHVVETYTDAAIDWGPKSGGGWEGQFLFASRDGTPAGRVGALASGAGLWSAWSEVTSEGPSVLLTLSADTQTTAIAAESGIFASLLVDRGNAEVGAYDWTTLGDTFVYAGLLADANGTFTEVDGRLDGYARTPAGGRQLLLTTPSGLEWFESSARPAIRVSANANGGAVAGRVDGATSGVVDIYRETAATRILAGHVELAAEGSFSFRDTPPLSPVPFVYRAVYVDPATSIPYASLVRSAVG